jgi:hypothetical protein
MTFAEWLDTEPLTGITNDDYMSAWLGWTAGQREERERERERIKQIIAEVGRQGNHDKWFDCADAIVERIKEVEE